MKFLFQKVFFKCVINLIKFEVYKFKLTKVEKKIKQKYRELNAKQN